MAGFLKPSDPRLYFRVLQGSLFELLFAKRLTLAPIRMVTHIRSLKGNFTAGNTAGNDFEKYFPV